MPSVSCQRCGAKIADRPAPEYVIQLTGKPLNNLMATVQFKRHLTFVDANGSTHNFGSLEIASLNYSLIAALLADDRQVLLFRKQPEQVEFYAVYPELRP